jgi:hypothetical protein
MKMLGIEEPKASKGFVHEFTDQRRPSSKARKEQPNPLL